MEWTTNKHGLYVCHTAILDGPIEVAGGDESLVYRDEQNVTLPSKVIPDSLFLFIGLDRGDIVEVEFNIETSRGIPLVQSSIHKEIPNNFDAWRQFKIGGYANEHLIDLKIVRSCRVNGKNELVPPSRLSDEAQALFPDPELAARVHFGLRIVGL